MPVCQIPAPRNLLVSYHYFQKADLDTLEGMNLIGDSGAFSAKTLGVEITTKQVADWAKRWQHRLAWVAALDVLYDKEQSRRNWEEMVDLGIPGIPTIHVGSDVTEMDYYAERGVDFMGLGGLIGCPYPKAARMRWLIKAFKYARDNHPQMRFHGWGAGDPEYVQLPFFTVDSSGWASGYMWARVPLRDPRDHSVRTLLFNGKQTYDHKIAELLRDVYGFNPSDVAKSAASNRPQIIRLSALSASVYEQQIRWNHRRRPVEAPKWGRLDGWAYDADGPHEHLVICYGGPKGGPTDHEVLVGMARGETLAETIARCRRDPETDDTPEQMPELITR